MRGGDRGGEGIVGKRGLWERDCGREGHDVMTGCGNAKREEREREGDGEEEEEEEEEYFHQRS